MVDFGKSDKMIKISGKVDKPNTDNRFSKEQNIKIAESVVSVGLSTFPLIFIIYTYI